MAGYLGLDLRCLKIVLVRFLEATSKRFLIYGIVLYGSDSLATFSLQITTL